MWWRHLKPRPSINNIRRTVLTLNFDDLDLSKVNSLKWTVSYFCDDDLLCQISWKWDLHYQRNHNKLCQVTNQPTNQPTNPGVEIPPVAGNKYCDNNNTTKEARLLLRDRATFVSFEKKSKDWTNLSTPRALLQPSVLAYASQKAVVFARVYYYYKCKKLNSLKLGVRTTR